MKLRKTLCASTMLAVLSATAFADTVDNPGSVVFTVQAGSGATIGTSAPLSFGGADPLPTLTATVDSSGGLTIAQADIQFQPIVLQVGTFMVTVTPTPLGDGTGSINPLTGEASASITATFLVSGFLVPAGCQVGPVTLNLSTAAGSAYDPTTGRATLVDNTFAVPAAAGCGLLGGIVDGQFGLPSDSGRNSATLVLSTNPILTGS